MATFCLVHGAWHSGSCWERLMPELTRLGHHAVTMDLPSADPDATFSDYADAVAHVLSDVDDEVVVVAHSLGGLTGALVPARRPVRRLAFVCALLPSPGRAFAEQLEDDPPPLVPGFDEGLERDEVGSEWRSFEGARRTFYADCDEETARGAFEQLRFQSAAPYVVPTELEAFPDVETLSIVCAEDRIVNPEWSRQAARERLGVEPIELPGSHSPFLSRPQALAAALASGL